MSDYTRELHDAETISKLRESVSSLEYFISQMWEFIESEGLLEDANVFLFNDEPKSQRLKDKITINSLFTTPTGESEAGR